MSTILKAARLTCMLIAGGVAQLARAREWHSRGRGFDSRRLH